MKNKLIIILFLFYSCKSDKGKVIPEPTYKMKFQIDTVGINPDGSFLLALGYVKDTSDNSSSDKVQESHNENTCDFHTYLGGCDTNLTKYCNFIGRHSLIDSCINKPHSYPSENIIGRQDAWPVLGDSNMSRLISYCVFIGNGAGKCSTNERYCIIVGHDSVARNIHGRDMIWHVNYSEPELLKHPNIKRLLKLYECNVGTDKDTPENRKFLQKLITSDLNTNY